jgi:hypothetical protein
VVGNVVDEIPGIVGESPDMDVIEESLVDIRSGWVKVDGIFNWIPMVSSGGVAKTAERKQGRAEMKKIKRLEN